MISEDDAIRIAKQLASENTWGWVEPTKVIFRKSWRGKPLRYEVYSNAHGLGTKVRVFVDANSGEILEQGYLPR